MQHNNFIAVTDGHQRKEDMFRNCQFPAKAATSTYTCRRRTAKKNSGRFTATTSWRNLRDQWNGEAAKERLVVSTPGRRKFLRKLVQGNHTNNYVFERWWAMKKTQQEYKKNKHPIFVWRWGFKYFKFLILSQSPQWWKWYKLYWLLRLHNSCLPNTWSEGL